LTATAAGVTSASASVSNAVKGIDDACHRMPETRAWSGRSHDAAVAMFGRADRDAGQFFSFASDVASVVQRGSGKIGLARITLLNKADQVDAGPLNVTDQWVVLIDPVRMSAEKMAEVAQLADEEQAAINAMLAAVGEADDATANAVVAAGGRFGFVEQAPSTDPFASPTTPTRPGDQVPYPYDPAAMMAQQAIRDGDMSISIREVTETVNQHGEEVTTVIMQDGSKQVVTRNSFIDWPDRQNFYTIVQYDKRGRETSRTSSWHSLGNDCDYTSVTWPDGSNLTMSMDPMGYRNAGFTAAGGRHSAVPVDLIDRMSLVAGSGLSGLEKYVQHGGSLPMVTAESVEKVGKAAKFAGPALTVVTTVFDMFMADSAHDRCAAAIAGAVGFGGGWGGAEFGAYLGASVGGIFPPAVPVTVAVSATAFALAGGFLSGEMGKVVGDVACPY
jgi:hypothetical protein